MGVGEKREHTCMQPCKLHYCIWRGLIKLSFRFSFFCVFFVSKATFKIFYFTWAKVITSLKQNQNCSLILGLMSALNVFGIYNITTIEPGHSIPYKFAYMPSDDSAQADQSPLSALSRFGSLATHRVPCENSDQTVWTRRLIWASLWRTCK